MPQDWRAQHDALLTRWTERARRVFRDGAVEAFSYWQEPRRIVYLLKEVNVAEGEAAWDLPSFLLEAKRGATWNMIAYWTFGLLNALPRWADVPSANVDFRWEWLRRIAVVNLNKAGGGASSDHRRLREIAVRDADLLREQLSLLDPDVVVCGGTGDLAAEFLFDSAPLRRLESGANLIDSRNGRAVVFAVAHPQSRCRGAELYASVIDTARELGLA
jgi:hypothetical protein